MVLWSTLLVILALLQMQFSRVYYRICCEMYGFNHDGLNSSYPACYFLFPLFSYIGWVVSSTLAGATIGSFTGGVLADKFGCTRTFQLDAIPLIIGAILR